MKKITIISMIFISIFVFTGSLGADVSFNYFEYIHESNYYIVHSNISKSFNYYLSVACESFFKRMKTVFSLNEEDFLPENRSWKESKHFKNMVLVFPERNELVEYSKKYLDTEPNGKKGFTKALRTQVNGIMNIAFFVPDISLDPYEEVYDYSQFFQALAEQFMKNYLGADIPDWLHDGIMNAVDDYDKNFVFSMFYRIEDYEVAVYERSFWADVVLFNKYKDLSTLTINDIINGSADKNHELYKSYTSLLAHYLIFNPPGRDRVRSKNLTAGIVENMKKGTLNNDTLKSIITEEYGSIPELQSSIIKHYSKDSFNNEINTFWQVYNNNYKSRPYHPALLYTTDNYASENNGVFTAGEMLSLIDGDRETSYVVDCDYEDSESGEFIIRKGESVIVNTKAVLPSGSVYIHFSDFALSEDGIDMGGGEIPVKARIVSSVNGKNWETWAYINSSLPIVYIKSESTVYFKYWGIVFDEAMTKPVTINEMWIR